MSDKLVVLALLPFIALVGLNVVVTALGLKIYTEIMKEKSQRGRQP